MMKSTTVCVVGGGPAGMVLGLLLARAGVAVTVLEKHADFLRDFRGDTVHPTTLALLDELGLRERFAALPQRRVQRISAQFDGGSAQLADFGRLRGWPRYIALVPQWDFLDLLAAAAKDEPCFTLRHDAEVVGLLREGDAANPLDPAGSSPGRGPTTVRNQGAVTGVRWRDRRTGEEHTLAATLTVACDGRFSTVRAAAGLRPRSFGVPIDVLWFRLPRKPSDPEGGVGRFAAGQMVVLIDRGHYWQCGYVIRKGNLTVLRAGGIAELRERLQRLVPWLADRVLALGSWDDVSLLNVELNRLRRWSIDGLALIGDAAHAMSPVGGVGINLAVADAVATARLLGRTLAREGRVGRRLLFRIQLRRWWPTALIQGGQRLAHRIVLNRALAAGEAGTAPEPAPAGGRAGLPWPIRVLARFPALQAIPARLVGVGPLPEHSPAWARRAAARPLGPGTRPVSA